MDLYKKHLIDEYLLPALGNWKDNEGFTNRLYELCRLQNAVKYQQLEIPGESRDGYLWFPISSMCHSYFYNKQKGRKIGTRIYKKRQFIFNDASLIEGAERTEYVEILESGEVLFISYPDLLQLINEYPELNEAVGLLRIKQGNYYRNHSALLNLPHLERVRLFRAGNDVFIYCSTQEVHAMHLNMCLRAYINQLKKLK